MKIKNALALIALLGIYHLTAVLPLGGEPRQESISSAATLKQAPLQPSQEFSSEKRPAP